MSAYAAVPNELCTRRQWVIWRTEERDGKPTKVPYRADGAGRASATDATTWGSFEAAVAASEALAADGIGYVFSPDDPFVGVDLDVFDSDAAAIVARLDSYTETSVSGRGVHVIVRASLNGYPRNRKGPLEVYGTGRYFTVTGLRLTGTPATIEDRQDELDDILARFLPAPAIVARRDNLQPVDVDDRELIDRAMAARNGDDFAALWAGAWEDRHPSQSEADLVLCGMLAFWTGCDPDRIDRLFRSSGLMRPKWNRDDYRATTISRAIAGCGDVYTAPRPNAERVVSRRTQSDNLAGVLDALVSFIQTYVVTSAAQADAIAVWIVHTWTIGSFGSTPYLSITSAEKRSGKTRLIEVLSLLVLDPLPAVNATEAALFRSLEQRPRTLLLDEVDAVFGPKAHDHEDLRALLNSGYRRGVPVLRCVGEGSKQIVKSFDVFGCKVLSGIGELPDTIADRCVRIRLKRRAPGEPVERLRQNRPPEDAAILREQSKTWADEHDQDLQDARPALPDELDDRAQDAVEPLLAVADLAGGTWPERARAALVELRRGDESSVESSLGVELLADIRAAFDLDGVDRLSTAQLIERLADDEEGPWLDWRGAGHVKPRTIGRLLGAFGVSSRTIRLDDGNTAKGFLREQLTDVWTRYLSSPSQEGVLSVTSVTTRTATATRGNPYPSHVSDSEEGANQHGYSDVADVTDRPPLGEGKDAGDNGRPDDEWGPWIETLELELGDASEVGTAEQTFEDDPQAESAPTDWLETLDPAFGEDVA